MIERRVAPRAMDPRTSRHHHRGARRALRRDRLPPRCTTCVEAPSSSPDDDVDGIVRLNGQTASVSVGDVAVGVLDHGGSAVLASLLTWVAVRANDSRGEVGFDDRAVSALNEDLRRFVLDRDHSLRRELLLITEEHAGRGPITSSVHINARAEAQRTALWQYRDEATRKIREYNDIVAREGWLHRQWRRRRGDPLVRLMLPAEQRDALARWREPARIAGWDSEALVDDPTRPELEPALADLERDDSQA